MTTRDFHYPNNFPFRNTTNFFVSLYTIDVIHRISMSLYYKKDNNQISLLTSVKIWNTLNTIKTKSGKSWPSGVNL